MSENLFSKFLLILFTTTSLGTSAVAGVKIVSQLQPELARATAPVAIENVTPSTVPPSPTPTFSPTSTIPPSTPTPTPLPNPNSCLITLFGQRYDVAPLKSNHPGGDIFVCNTDMTTTYQGVHGTNVSRMTPYLLTSTIPQPTPPMSPTPTPSFRPVTNDDHSEDEDLEEAEHESEDQNDDENHDESEEEREVESEHE